MVLEMSSNNCESVVEDFLDVDEELEKLESILIQRQELRNDLKRRMDSPIGPNEVSEPNASEVWKMERIESLAQLLDTDCERIHTQRTVLCDQMDHKIKELKTNSEIISKPFKDLNDFIKNVDQNVDKCVHNLDEFGINPLEKEINKLEKQLAWIEVWFLESPSVQQLLSLQTQLKAEVKRLENDIKNLN